MNRIFKKFASTAACQLKNPKALIRTNTEHYREIERRLFDQETDEKPFVPIQKLNRDVQDIIFHYGVDLNGELNDPSLVWLNHFRNKYWIDDVKHVYLNDHKMNPYGLIFYSLHNNKIFTDKYKLEKEIDKIYNNL